MMLEPLTQLFRPLTSFWQKNRTLPVALPLVIVFVTVLLLLLLKAGQPETPVKLQEEKTWLVQTQKLADGYKSPHVELYGQVESPYTATITAGLNADVKTLDALEGQHVNSAQQLITLDEMDAQLALKQRNSDVVELEALIESEKNRYKNDLAALKIEKSLVALAEKKLAREEKTSKSNLTSQSSFDSQKQALQNQKLALKSRQLNVTDHSSRLSQLEAKLARNNALAEQAQNDLQRATVVAPFDGIILKTSVSPGERVRPGDVLLEIYATDHVELRAQLPQRFVAVVKKSLADGIELQAAVQTSTGKYEVVLDRVSGAIAEGGHGVDALFKISNHDVDAFTMGEVLELTLMLPAINNVFSVPVSAIYGTNRIYRVEAERLVAVNVEKIANQYKEDKQYVLIRSEKLSVGDEIIITQLAHAHDGLKIEVNNAPLSSELE